MNISLKNIGTLDEANFDLDRELIVFIGPNNTGKTYASYCLYGMDKVNVGLSQEFVNSVFKENLDPLFTNGSIEFDLQKLFTYNTAKQILDRFGMGLKEYLSVLFALNNDVFEKSAIQYLFKDELDYVLYLRKANFFLAGSNFKDIIFHYRKDNDSLMLVVDIHEFTHAATLDSIDREHIYTSIKRNIIEYIFKPLNSVWDSHFIPAERIGISIFSNDVFSNRFTKTNEIFAANAYSKISEINPYSVIIQDALKSYNDLSRTTERLLPPDEAMVDLADELEREILKGKVSTSKAGNIYFHDGSRFQLKLQGAGSIIKSLTSLLLFLRYEARSGQMLIIDEPEINLHPDNQRRIARILAKLSKLGVKVIVSTHSDYFIKELNNLIMLNKDHPEAATLRAKYGYGDVETLDYKKVGAYLFKNNKATVLEVTPAGMEAATIDEEINKLNNTATDIYWTLFED